MPEGHTTHALARDLQAAFGGAPVEVTSPQGRFAEGAALLDGRPLVQASAWGKHLFLEFAGDAILHVHLGLIGKFRIARIDRGVVPPPVGEVRLRLRGSRAVADLRGPNLCAVVTPDEVATVTGRLGPDPLRPGADPAHAWSVLHRSRRSIAELLMDQKVLAGVGNVYRCEILFRHRIDPACPGERLRPASWTAMWEDLVRLMPLAVAAGQILTMDDQVEEATAEYTTVGTVSPKERRFYVYKRTGEPCRVCSAKIRTRDVVGRNLFWCGRCQRRH